MIWFLAFILFLAAGELVSSSGLLNCEPSEIAYEEITRQGQKSTNTLCKCKYEPYKFSTATSKDKTTVTVQYKCKQVRPCVYGQKCQSLEDGPQEKALKTHCTCAKGQQCHSTPEHADESRIFGDTKYYSFVCV
uniref:U-scoloptoxin(11)-Sm1a n=1 Tax=Scolopendra morsitans TaxID=943129 RepID=TXB1A_SCOMO|nr:RecName: Full=U-scoloptoxin(11)-Sm1a; Short=U-SLPTX(11)-Sm1a; Flags: Precursor [Scolopendra morsitans]